MSHHLYPIDGRPELLLDESFVDGSYFVRPREEVAATFAPGWEAHLGDPVSLRAAEQAMFRSHFETFGTALVCTQCGARFEMLGRNAADRSRRALLHMRANSYRACPADDAGRGTSVADREAPAE